jgi:uncharacterized ferritin-like protein (DUF455 family)
MELRAFAEQILFATTLEEKLQSPPLITDERPGPAVVAPETPGRPAELRFKPQHAGKANIPGVHSLDRPSERGRLLHFFANHELLATELMALVLLRFPDAPPAFRRGVLQTLKDEQLHTRWYVSRMKECGVAFGELPVSGYFWRAISSMQSPLDYVAGLNLTFEQANLDFARFFGHGFAVVGDQATAQLLERIYRDEIAHVAQGLKWFRKWKNPQQSDWEAFCQQLKFPLSAQRAKGPVFNVEGRLAAGFEAGFISELEVCARSKGRTPTIWMFNPFAEGRIAHGKSFTPNQYQRNLQRDLENLPQFLCRQDDVVLVERRPSTSFLNILKQSGCALPEFVELRAGLIDPRCDLHERKIARLRPWAWGPDSVELLEPLFASVSAQDQNPTGYFNADIARLYSKTWSAARLRQLLKQQANLHWLCTEHEVGVVADTVAGAIEAIEAIRRRGHQKIVIKEALGIAGHNAIRLLEPELLQNQLRWIANIVETGGELVIEPWLERELDFSVQLEMNAQGLKLLGYTELSSDSRGQYRGNRAAPGFARRICANLPGWFPSVRDISNRVQRLYSDLLAMLEQEFLKVGYRGPAGIDAFIYRTPDGECRLKPIVEINPRYTMGRLTLELMKQVVPGGEGRLRLINLTMVRKTGFTDFSSWARTACERSPIWLESQPVPKIRQGTVCLNDPESAQVCLAVFEVS